MKTKKLLLARSTTPETAKGFSSLPSLLRGSVYKNLKIQLNYKLSYAFQPKDRLERDKKDKL